MSMTQEQIEAERSRGRLAALAAVGAAIAFAIGGYWYQSINSDAPERNGPALLRFFDRHTGELLGASALQSLGMVLLVGATVHMYRALKARRPDQPGVVFVMGVYGPLAFGASTMIRAIALAVSASHFTSRAFQTIDAADDIFKGPVIIFSTVLGLSGVIALAFWLVKASLDAMRVGLLGRFMGIVGVAIGPALVLGFGSILLPVWLLALAAVYVGLWPRGLPPAWRAGEAVALPRIRESLEPSPQAAGLGGRRNGEVDAVGPGVRRADEPAPGADSPAPGAEPRRKRKRRQ